MRSRIQQLIPRRIRGWFGRTEIQRIASNTVWLIADRSLRMVLGLVTMVWLARHLGVEGFGTYNYVVALVLLFSEFTTLGLNSLLVRELVRDAERRELTMGTAFSLRVASGWVSVAAAYLLVRILRPEQSDLHLLVVILSVGVVFRAFEVVDHFFQSRVEARYPASSRMIASLVITATTVGMLLAGAPLATFIYLRAAEFALVGTVLLLFYRSRIGTLHRWRFRPELGRELLSHSWPLILSGFGAIVYLKVDQVMLGQMIGDSAVGLYAVAAQLSEVWYFFPVAVANSVFPSLIERRQQDRGAYHSRFQTLYNLLVLGALAIALPTTLLAQPIISLLYGSAYAAAGTILAIHIWASVFIFMRAALSKWLIAEGLFLFSLLTHGAGAVSNIALNLLLIPRFGGVGAAVATVISYGFASYFALFAHPSTRPAAFMMSRALFTPIRELGRLIRLVRLRQID